LTLNISEMAKDTAIVTMEGDISEMAKDTAIVTMEGEYETVPKLSNGTTFSDLE